jgi:hypothetical protein
MLHFGGTSYILCPSAVIRLLKFSHLSMNKQCLLHMDSGLSFDCFKSESPTPGHSIKNSTDHISVTGCDLVVEFVSDPAGDRALMIRIWCE